MLQGALSDLRHELLADVDSGDRCAFAFRLSGRHTGPLDTPLGPLAATGRELMVAGMDIFVLRDGRIAEVWAVADMLGSLAAAGADRRRRRPGVHAGGYFAARRRTVVMLRLVVSGPSSLPTAFMSTGESIIFDGHHQ